MSFKAILWDCDGCLIDSEVIACGHAAEELTSAGYPIGLHDFVTRFAGKSRADIYASIKAECGLDLNGRIDPAVTKREREARFVRELKAIEDIHETLEDLTLPMAIASGSEMPRLEQTLKLTNLYDRFMPHVYSSSLVAHGKPAPDIFLYAATQLDVSPADCLVIEDSENGVRAGKAAGMTVFGFTGGSHVPDPHTHAALLRSLGADDIFHHMSALPLLLQPIPDLLEEAL
jgi:HAD superfamily hydrolase (TIGR01509 family)